MYCRNCKNEIRDGSRYCKYCGAPQYTESAVSGPVSGNVVKTEGKMRRRIIIMVVAAAVLLGVFFWARAHLFSGEPARQAAPWEKKLTEDFLLPAREGEKYGYKNLDGEWMIEPQFEGANLFFDNGTAIVVKGSRALLIDRQGNAVNAIGINSEVAAAGRLSSYFQDDFVNGKVPITWSENGWNEKKGFMDEEGNVTVFPDNLSLAGDVEKSCRMQLEAIELIDALFCEVNPIPVKTALNLMGKEVGPMRGPLCEMEEKNVERLKKAMKDYGIL